jgi:RNA polymerase sigma-70 factor, ECF subfamily
MAFSPLTDAENRLSEWDAPDANTSDDASLVLRSQKGDRFAFEELVRRTARIIFTRIFTETGDVHRTEDLAQETFLNAWRSIGQVTEPAGFRSWLFHVAHSAVVDARRRDSRKKRAAAASPRVNDANALDTVEAHGGRPDDAASLLEERQRVLSVLRSLPAEYREPLMLRYIAGTDYDTIGRQLGISNGSLRGMLTRGMAMLRAELTRGTRGDDVWK